MKMLKLIRKIKIKPKLNQLPYKKKTTKPNLKDKNQEVTSKIKASNKENNRKTQKILKIHGKND